MTNQEDLNKLYKKFSFIEEDISKFKEIAFINNAEDFIDAEKNIFEYIGNIIKKDGLVKIFEKATKKIPFKTAFELFSLIIEETNTTISDEDIEELSNKKEYEKFYSKITKNVEDGDYDIDDLNISNDLLKRVIEVKLDSLETYDLEHLEFGDDDKFITNIFKDYLKTLYQFKVLTREEEKELFEKYKNSEGEERDELKEKIVNHNLRLVVAIAKKHKPPTLRMDIMDYIQFGNIGLLKALDKYDVEKGNKFSTYATWWIRQSLSRSVADNDTTIRIPVHMFETVAKSFKKEKEFTTTYNREPTNEEMMQILGLNEKQYKAMMKARNLLDLTSLDTKIDSNDKESRKTSLISFVTDTDEQTIEEQVEKQIEHEQLEEIMKLVLKEREMKILKLRVGFDTGEEMTLEAVGKIMGVTRERIRQIEAKAIRKLHGYYNGVKNKSVKDIKLISLDEYKRKQKLEEEKLERKVDELMKRKTFYELVKGTEEEVDKIKETLSEEDKYLIEIRENGEPLTPEQRDKFKLIVSRVKTRLGTRRDQLAKAKKAKVVEKKKTIGKPAKSIYNLIDNSSGRLYNMIMSDLSEEEKDIVMKREHYILDKKDADKLTPDEQKKFNYIVKKLKIKMNKPPKAKQPKKTKKITKEELKEELTLSDKAKDFNENLKAFNEKAKDIIHESELQKEEPTKEIVKEEPNKEFETNYKTLLSIAMKDPRIMKRIDIIDLSITCVRYGIGKSEKPRDIDTIAKFYGITTETVEEISTRVLKELYDVLVDGIIDSNAKQYVKIANQNNKEE